MKECYEYFNCTKTDCVKRQNPNIPCWELDNTLCAGHYNGYDYFSKTLGSKIETCKFCFYYKP